MEAIFRKSINSTDTKKLLSQLRPVLNVNPQTESRLTLLHLLRQTKRNSDYILSYVELRRQNPSLTQEQLIMLDEMWNDALHCSTQSVILMPLLFLPGRARIRKGITALSDTYEQLRLSAILVCQDAEPTLMDSVAFSL